MAIQATVQNRSNGLPAIEFDGSTGLYTVYLTLVFTGNYPGAPGDILNLNTAILPPGFTLPVSGTVQQGWAQSANPAGVSGYLYNILQGSTLANIHVEVQQSSGSTGPHQDIPTSAYPSGVLTDTVQCCLVIAR